VAESKKPKWKRFEKLITTIQKALSPGAVVTPNEKIVGQLTGIAREVDISVRHKTGQFNLLIVIDCKDYAEPVDVKDVEEFIGLVQDVAANKGAMVAPMGFSTAAKTRARKAGIDLFRPVDTGEHEWRVYAALPMLCVFTELTKFSVRFSWTGRGAIPTDIHPRDIVLYAEDRTPLGTIGELVQKQWRNKRLPAEVGVHENLSIVDGATKIRVGDEFNEIRVHVSIRVESKTYLGSIPLTELSGLRDEVTGTVSARHFLTELVTPKDIEEKWQPISDPDQLVVKPAFRLRAMITLDLGDVGPGHQSVAFRVEAPEAFNVEIDTQSSGPLL